MDTTREAQRGSIGAARVLTIIACVCAVIAIFFIPLLFGIVGIVLAAIGWAKGDPLAKWALAGSVLGMILGLVLGALVLHAAST